MDTILAYSFIQQTRLDALKHSVKAKIANHGKPRRRCGWMDLDIIDIYNVSNRNIQ
jgi:hypothetical protein